MLRSAECLDWLHVITGPFVTEQRELMSFRQVDELQEQVEKLKAELAAKEDNTGPSSMQAVELENSKHLELIAELKLQLGQVRLLSLPVDDAWGSCQGRSGRRILTK